MTIAIDSAGRIVIPKAIRDREGLAPGTELEIHSQGGVITLERPNFPVRLERHDGRLVMVCEGAPPLTTEEVNEFLRQVREERDELDY